MTTITLTTTPAKPSDGYGEFQFYPTPVNVIIQLIAQYHHVYGIALEPSAGRGDIADRLAQFGRGLQVVCCEVSPDLRAILHGKGHKVIGTDFLQLAAPYLFNLIVMNPPFHNGGQHVLKAWEMLAPCGELAAIVPADFATRVRGSYEGLADLVSKYGKSENIGSAFKGAERTTDIKCVIIRLKKPDVARFEPFAGYRPAEDEEYKEPTARQLPASRDLIKAIVAQYRAAVRALKATHDAQAELDALVPDNTFSYDHRRQSYAEQIDSVKAAFWNLIFDRTKIAEVTTSGYRKDFMAKREQLQMMEFSEETIYEVLHIFMSNREAIFDECVLDVFKQATRYSRDNATKSEQWATNKGWKINKKIIIPYALREYGDWSLDYQRQHFIDDLDKVLAMFGGKNGVSTAKTIDECLIPVRSGQAPYTAKFETPNFTFRVFKKRTIHLMFKDLKALELINRYAAERNMFVLGSGL